MIKNNKHYGLREQKDKLSACKYALNHIEIFTVLCIDYVFKGQFTVPKWFTYFPLAFSAIYPSRLFRCNLPSFGSICCTDIMGCDGSCCIFKNSATTSLSRNLDLVSQKTTKLQWVLSCINYWTTTLLQTILLWRRKQSSANDKMLMLRLLWQDVNDECVSFDWALMLAKCKLCLTARCSSI